MTINEIHTYGRAYNALLARLADSGMTNAEYRHIIALHLDGDQFLSEVKALLKTKPNTKLCQEATRNLFNAYLLHINPRCPVCRARTTPPEPCGRCKILTTQKALETVTSKRTKLRFGHIRTPLP